MLGIVVMLLALLAGTSAYAQNTPYFSIGTGPLRTLSVRDSTLGANGGWVPYGYLTTDHVFVSTPSMVLMQGNAIGSAPRNFPNAAKNLAFFSGNGPQLSYCSWMEDCTSGPQGKTTDTAYIQGVLRMQSQQPVEIAEYTLSLDTLISTGFAGSWVTNLGYSIGDRVKSNGNVYRATTTGTSGTSAPSGTGASFSDGGVTWAYVGAISVDNKVGINNVVQLGTNAGHTWGVATNVIMLPGSKSDGMWGIESDAAALAKTCAPGIANCYNIFLYGETRHAITSEIEISTPPTTPAVGLPAAWQPDHDYSIDPTLGAPVVSNGGHYYVLIQNGHSALSGGPTGTTEGASVTDNTAKWAAYNADFTGGPTGGATLDGITFRGYNTVRGSNILDGTHSLYALRGDPGAVHTSFIKDESHSGTMLDAAGAYSFAGIYEHSAAGTPFGLLQDGNYTSAAHRYQDYLLGKISDSATNTAVSFNGTLTSVGMNGWFGKAGDSILHGNAIGAYDFKVAGTTTFAINAGYIVATGGGVSCVFTPATGASGTFACPSDEALKRDISDAGPALPQLDSMPIRDYTVKATGQRKTGVVAQELRRTQPDMVHEGQDGLLVAETPNPWLLVKAVQELHATNDNLRLELRIVECLGVATALGLALIRRRAV